MTYSLHQDLPTVMMVAVLRRDHEAEKRLVASSCTAVRLSAHMVQLGSHWTDFHVILYTSTFRKSVEKIKILLQIITIITGTLHEDQYLFLSYLDLFLE
jgi:hypothetical protein